MRYVLIVLTFVWFIVIGGFTVWFVGFRNGKQQSGIGKILMKWRKGDFKDYKKTVINHEKFEEILFLNSLLGRSTLRCEYDGNTLTCEGFSPIRIRKYPSSLKILGDIYLLDTSKSLLKKRLIDWKSKIHSLSHYDALQLCVKQIRNYSEIDSLYLEKLALENDIKFWKSVKDRKINGRFFEIFKRRFSDGHICINHHKFLFAERIFSKSVKSPKISVKDYAEREIKRLNSYVKIINDKISLSLKNSYDPLAEAFYKRGLEYVAKGDYHSARIYFERALKVDPRHQKAKEALERVRRVLSK